MTHETKRAFIVELESVDDANPCTGIERGAEFLHHSTQSSCRKWKHFALVDDLEHAIFDAQQDGDELSGRGGRLVDLH